MDSTTYMIDLNLLHLPADPPVESVRVAEVIDSLGDPALRVRVLMKESVSDEGQWWRRVRPIKEEIRQFLRERHGSDRFPYFNFLTPTDLKKESFE